MEPGGLLLCSQDHVTRPSPKPVECSQNTYDIFEINFNIIFLCTPASPSGFPTKVLHQFIIVSMRDIPPIHPIIPFPLTWLH
jgi:hypothetical protein